MEIFALVQPILAAVYVAAIVVCVLFVSLINKTSLPNKRFLVAFLSIKVLIIFCEWLLVHFPPPSHYFWLASMMVLSFGPAPLLLRFAQSVIQESQSPSIFKLKHWEWAIVIISILLTLPLLFASQVLFSFEFNAGFGRFIHLTMSICIVLFVFQVLLYWLQARKIYWRELQNLKQHFSNLKHYSLKILRILLVLVLSNCVFSLVRTFNVWFWQSQSSIALVANFVEYGMMLVCLFVLFQGFMPINMGRQDSLTLPSGVNAQSSNQLASQGTKYAKAYLETRFRQNIINKLNNSALTAELARDNAISLIKFAKAIGEKPHYISQVLNQDLNTNFYEYITERRIDEVVQRLSQPSELTIYAIALEAGFNAKSTFNTAFKKRTGLTPSAFRRNHQAIAAKTVS